MLVLVNIITGFLRNKRSENYEEPIDYAIECFCFQGVHIRLKIHIFDSHLDFFLDNMGAVSWNV